jgi:Predicted integral membrane protein (DUF2269)
MSWYEFLLFGHLTAVAAWVGGDIMLQALSFRALAASGERQIAFTSDVEWVGMRLLVPASVLVLLFGFGLVSDGDWDMGQFWLLAGIAVFLASAITGAGFLGPETGRISRLAEERGAEAPEVRARVKRVVLISRIELVLLVLLIGDMVAKPGL